MTVRTATVTKEWGEIGFGSSKREGWAWEVRFFENDKLIETATIKEHLEEYARSIAERFEDGD